MPTLTDWVVEAEPDLVRLSIGADEDPPVTYTLSISKADAEDIGWSLLRATRDATQA